MWGASAMGGSKTKGKKDVELTPIGMTSKQFKSWRKRLDLKQKDAADCLGLKKRMIQYYETGERDGKAVEIPLYVRLACYAIEKGCADFDGENLVRRPRKVSRKPVDEHQSENNHSDNIDDILDGLEA